MENNSIYFFSSFPVLDFDRNLSLFPILMFSTLFFFSSFLMRSLHLNYYVISKMVSEMVFSCKEEL